MENGFDYQAYKNFIGQYLPQGFKGISRLDPFIVDLEEKLRIGNQFFAIVEMLKIRVEFTSWDSTKMIGITPEQLDFSGFFPLAHPQDQERLLRSQAKVFKGCTELYNHKNEGQVSLVSVQIRERNRDGNYFNLLIQTYGFYSKEHDTVFLLVVATDLASIKPDSERFHYYAGDDLSMFRYPDEALLKSGHSFSHRELEILQMIAQGMGSGQIADKLFLSVNTINTHRRNILLKTKKSNTHELVMELQEKGIL